MGKVSLKIVIAGRSYPLTVNQGEETLINKAVHEINTNIQKLQENYAVKDMQDLLAMTALQLATRSNKTSSEEEKNDLKSEEVLSALKKLSQNIDVE